MLFDLNKIYMQKKHTPKKKQALKFQSGSVGKTSLNEKSIYISLQWTSFKLRKKKCKDKKDPDGLMLINTTYMTSLQFLDHFKKRVIFTIHTFNNEIYKKILCQHSSNLLKMKKFLIDKKNAIWIDMTYSDLIKSNKLPWKEKNNKHNYVCREKLKCVETKSISFD